ncbi:MAG: CBS domain-containing protein [Candidatus Bathyarchaeota archaeon]|jgi:CBS domain-containing protein
MSDMGLRSKMLVRDVMSSPPITVNENTRAHKIAELMDKHALGCIIVTGKKGKPIGIITERDLVRRILAKNVKPDSIKAKEVMTSPLITVDPDKKISETARKMSSLNIRRLGVVYKGQLLGVLSSKDVLSVVPELIETIQERTILEEQNKIHEEIDQESTPLAGYCDSCGSWSNRLEEVDGEFLCEDCAAD